MSMITVYRVENTEGIGPYLGNYDHIIDPWAHGPHNGRPGWENDVKDFTEDGERIYYHCKQYYHAGFKSITQLFSWFGGYLPKFYLMTDLRVKKFIVPEEHIMQTISGKQILFVKPGTDYKPLDQITEVDFEIDEIPF